MYEKALDVTNASPRHGTIGSVEERKAHDDT
jgi:hypothetical protein